MKVIAWDGNPISKPGIYSGVPISVYHSGRLCVGPSISSSGLRTIFSESEAHFWDKCPLNPDAEPMEETGSLVLGRATHHLLLGEANFVQEFALRPSTYPDDPKKPWSGNSKECKGWLADQRKAGKTVVTPEQMEKIKGMALRLGREPLVRAGALNGLIECTMAVLDEETGVWLLARPDVIPTDSGDYVDLKTTTSVLYPDLVRTIGDYGYHQQGALVEECHEILTGQPVGSFSLYFVETTRPYCARLVQLKSGDLQLGRQQNRNAVRRFARALSNNVWAGPGGNQDSVQAIEINDFARKSAEAKLKFEQVF